MIESFWAHSRRRRRSRCCCRRCCLRMPTLSRSYRFPDIRLTLNMLSRSDHLAHAHAWLVALVVSLISTCSVAVQSWFVCRWIIVCLFFFLSFSFIFKIYLCIASRVLSVNAKFSVCTNIVIINCMLLYTHQHLAWSLCLYFIRNSRVLLFFRGVFSRISDCLCAQFLCIHSCVLFLSFQLYIFRFFFKVRCVLAPLFFVCISRPKLIMPP